MSKKIVISGDGVTYGADIDELTPLLPAGPQGEQGIQGIPGSDGAQGAQGIQGVPGNNGASGAQGEQGVQGVPGNDGAAGPNSVSTSTDSVITGLLKGAVGKVAQATADSDYQSTIFRQAEHDVLPNPHHSNSLDHDGPAQDTVIAGKADTGHNHTGTYEPAKGADDNFVTDSEKSNLHAPGSDNQDLSGKSDVGHTHPGGSEAFPVGSVFLSVVSTNPATLLGYGTWSAIAAGKMLVGLDSGDADFDTAEETGGAKTKTIAQANLPNISVGAGTSHNHIQDQHRHQTLRERSATTGGAATQIARNADTSSTVDTAINTEYTTPTNQAEAAHTHLLGGSGTALNVVNPYFVVYMFKRTA